jgi:hypothetical protein
MRMNMQRDITELQTFLKDQTELISL